PKINVVVASTNIPARTRITSDMVKLSPYPTGVAPAAALTRIDQAVNLATVTDVYAGQPIVASQVVTTTKETSIASAALEKGKVLVAVAFGGANHILSTGAIQTGDSVDVVLQLDSASGPAVVVTYQNLKVYGMGTVAPTKSGSNSIAVGEGPKLALIFAVTPQEAAELKFLESLNPDLFLRSVADRDGAPYSTQKVDMTYILNKYRLDASIMPPRR
ncbi:MAG: Flp pilus assembly protein CpaB, partial [Chloroflexota bacterium]